jgi:hypothetical protein
MTLSGEDVTVTQRTNKGTVKKKKKTYLCLRALNSLNLHSISFHDWDPDPLAIGVSLSIKSPNKCN